MTVLTWVSQVAFQAWSCYDFEGGGYLKEDVSISCGSSEHSRVKAIAIAAVLLYPVGLLVLQAWLLFAARHAIQKKRPTALSRSIAFLHQEYTPRRSTGGTCFLLPTSYFSLH